MTLRGSGEGMGHLPCIAALYILDQGLTGERFLLLAVMIRALPLLLCAAFGAQAQDAGALRARHAALQKQIADSPFGRPLHVGSSAAGGAHKGEIFAVLDQPYHRIALAHATHWCEILMLQVNVKRCDAHEETLSAFITRKAREPVDSAHRIDFRYQPATSRDYLRVQLSASAGPMGTRDYRIVVEAAALDARRTLLHMSYGYKLGWSARLALDAYLAGAGRDKRGFSVEGGERGVIERGAMRHYLAVEAYLASKDLERRLRHWYAAIASYPQLRERVGLEEYVAMKRREAAG
jgi:hypothetical protein